jgi:hypothetical protein
MLFLNMVFLTVASASSESGTLLRQTVFRVLSPTALEKMSVKEIRNPETFTALGHPTSDGLHNALLGTVG